jgi:hypothetical protein
MQSFVQKLDQHPENNRRLFWLDGISDEYLEKIYTVSCCLIAPSEGEGFGLPLIEAARHKLPIIARDIPVFREVVGEHGFYFTGGAPKALADGVLAWRSLEKEGQAPQSSAMPWLTWKQSTERLLNVISDGQWYQQWMVDNVHRFWASDSCLHTKVGKRIEGGMVSEGRAGLLIFGPYIPLAAGQYRVKIHGSIGENGLHGAKMDVVVNKGNHILGESALWGPDDDGCLVMRTISLDEPCTDLEIRVWVSRNTDLQISMLEIGTLSKQLEDREY